MAGPSNPVPLIPQPTQPLANTQPQIPNLNQSAFSPSSQNTTATPGQNPRTPVPITPQNTPNFGNNNSTNLIASNTALVQAIQNLTRTMGGGRGGNAGGNAAPNHSAPGGLTSQIAAGPNGGTSGGTNNGASNGTNPKNQVGQSTMGSKLQSTFNAFATPATSAAGVFQNLSGIPYIGSLLAGIGAPLSVATQRFGAMSNYEKVATAASLQMNESGRQRLNLPEMNAAVKQFGDIGIGPTEAADMFGQMFAATGQIFNPRGLKTGVTGRNTGARAPLLDANQDFYLNDLVNAGYSPSTAGFIQRFNTSRFNASGTQIPFNFGGNNLTNDILPIGRQLGLNDAAQNQLNATIYGMQQERALSGARTGLTSMDVQRGIGGFYNQGFGEFSGTAFAQRESKSRGLGQQGTTFGNLGQDILEFEYLREAGFDRFEAQKLSEEETGQQKANRLLKKFGGNTRRAKEALRNLPGANYTTTEVESFFNNQEMPVDPLKKYSYTGNEVAQKAAEIEFSQVTQFRALVTEIAGLNNTIETKLLQSIDGNTKGITAAAMALVSANTMLLEGVAELTAEMVDFAKDVKEKGLFKTIKDRALWGKEKTGPGAPKPNTTETQRQDNMQEANDRDEDIR